MTHAVTAQIALPASVEAGRALGAEILEKLAGASPDVVIVFASPAYDYSPLLAAISAASHPGLLLGCSSAGEFTDSSDSSASVSAMALRSTDLVFNAGLARNLYEDRPGAARQLASSFQGRNSSEYRYRYALVLADVLAGYTEDFLEHLTLETAGQYQFFGGGAADDARFSSTHVFFGTEAVTGAAVALEILSQKRLGIGVGHGWEPATPHFRVTEALSSRVGSLNATPAAEVYRDFAAESSQEFNEAEPLPFFLHHVLGIHTGEGYKLRVPLGVNPDQSISCAADVPSGVAVSIMAIQPQAAAMAAAQATRAALDQVEGPPAAALFFDCAATRLRLGRDFGTELESVSTVLGPIPFAGCNTYGQIARADGQFSGFHNCTAVVCVIPE